jgi:hypothetical protein
MSEPGAKRGGNVEECAARRPMRSCLLLESVSVASRDLAYRSSTWWKETWCPLVTARAGDGRKNPTTNNHRPNGEDLKRDAVIFLSYLVEVMCDYFADCPRPAPVGIKYAFHGLRVCERLHRLYNVLAADFFWTVRKC